MKQSPFCKLSKYNCFPESNLQSIKKRRGEQQCTVCLHNNAQCTATMHSMFCCCQVKIKLKDESQSAKAKLFRIGYAVEFRSVTNTLYPLPYVTQY